MHNLVSYAYCTLHTAGVHSKYKVIRAAVILLLLVLAKYERYDSGGTLSDY